MQPKSLWNNNYQKTNRVFKDKKDIYEKFLNIPYKKENDLLEKLKNE